MNPSKQLIELEMMKSYAQQALRTEIIGLVTGLMMAVYFWNESNQQYLSFWLVLLISGPFLHHWLIYRFDQNKMGLQQASLWLQVFWFASGSLWGLFF